VTLREARPPAPDRRARNAHGMMIMFAATLVMVLMHTAVRHIGQQMPVAEVVFFRNLFGLLVVAPLVLREGVALLRTRKPALHLLRSCIGIAAMWLWFYALSVVPVAEATALSFTSVIFGSIAAAVLLGERMRLRRWSAVVIGFLGAMVILRPGFQTVSVGLLAVLASSVFWALALILVKHLSRWDSVVCIVALNQLLLTVFSLVPAVLVWQTPTPTQLAWLLGIGICATFGHILMTTAFKLGEASAIFPVDFARLIWAALAGYLIFAEVPDQWTWLGGGIIFASTAYITYRETQVRRAERKNQKGT
jgi:drug/metabolite transporter (DMT)-like permease